MSEEKTFSHERILICIALALCAIIIGYNVFFVPTVSTPTIIYTDEDMDKEIHENNFDKEAEQNNIAQQDLNNNSSSNQSTDIKKDNKININSATEEELSDGLTGIGDIIAKRIVEYREQNNGFDSIEEIINVNGIGDDKFEAIKDDICV